MIKKFKILPVAFLMFAMLISFTLTACAKKAELSITSNIIVNTNTTITYLTENAYNNTSLGTQTTFSVLQIKETLTDLNYYINVGTMKNIDSVNSIKIGSTTFNKDQEFELSIGNSNKIKDDAFYVENNILYVAAPIIAFENINNNTIKVNDSTFDFNLTPAVSSITFTEIKFENTTNTATRVSDTEYDLTITNGTSYLEFHYDDATVNDVVLTKKILNSTSISYGLTKVENVTGFPLVLYPIGWVSDMANLNSTTYNNNSVMNYSAYIINVGIANVKLNYTISTLD